ncbi:MAG TPA: ABC transporter ATP-binding protein [Ilumatobacteraceae bacterium]|nr:ABC transporter ATP-binding protein [Ilumatobacteraceae bacterium]
MTQSTPLLEIHDLDVRFSVRGGQVHAVRGLDLAVHPGEVAAVVGESGSGKSATMLAALGLLDVNATATGSVRFDGVELLRAAPAVLRGIRGGRIGMIFQDPMTSLNPVLEIRRQIAEAVITHQHVSPRQAEFKAVELLEMVSFPDAARRARSYPHELSGGMRQRVMIAMALANDPDILIADEPTTALDVTVQAQILDLLRSLRQSRELAIVLITHDLGVVAGLADSVHVMYAGRIAESGPVVDIFHRPQHPYTIGLLASLPRLDRPDRELTPIGGVPPRLYEAPVGCAFAPRCKYAIAACTAAEPTLQPVNDSLVACVVLPMAERTSEAAR